MSEERAAVLDRVGLDRLFEVLVEDGYRVVGPTVRDEAIVLEELDSAAWLPAGWGVDTAPGRYRLRRREDAAVFGHSAGPQSWKKYLHPARRQLWSTGDDGEFRSVADEPRRYAFFGVRGCDLASIAVLGRVLGDGGHPDGAFARRCRGLFVVAANCTEPGEVCFCASMGTGPEAGPGYDLSLTERIDGAGHRFLVEIGSAEGARILARVGCRDAAEEEISSARAEVAAAAGRMRRTMPDGLPALMRGSYDSPVWAAVASRCLTCANCTMVCPTCFCTTTEDVTDLTGEHAERWQHWASCFELDFSYLHGGSVRTSGASRYRQWMTHKLGTWHDQFGGSGCVGCGRCIAWCPAGIDITEEAAKLAGERP
ncbi:4Fe-4S dicluster domain-containing protein [Amycolatopsis anabasis]|uniref:4Fe-4S dicluster domain-containing protein n=1 Tax=Amycolatopsis anabasis TaxID=1840409 RepID=UPI00131D7B10|nr:4Fe-4S dicluster domain-containing protein [Amycolatopsis anabasis]